MLTPYLRTIASGLLLLTLLLPAAFAGSDPAVRLTFEKLSEWREKSFKGHTSYSLVHSDGRTVLQAEAAGTASALYHKISVNAAELPLINWSWKIKQTLAGENPYRKDGDDFAARVYVVFPGRFFWQNRALVYVWSDKLPTGTVIPSPFTGNIAVICIETGNTHAGTWRHESRNYVEDYRSYFHAKPPAPVAVAVMTDADNTGGEAAAWYGDITFARDTGASGSSGDTVPKGGE